jgi:hypothetical protein
MPSPVSPPELADLEVAGETLPAGSTVEFHVPDRPSLTVPGRRSPTVPFRWPERFRATV